MPHRGRGVAGLDEFDLELPGIGQGEQEQGKALYGFVPFWRGLYPGLSEAMKVLTQKG